MFYLWSPFSWFVAGQSTGQCTLTNPADPFQRLAWKIYFNPTLPGRCLSTNFISSAGIQPSSSLLNTRKVSWNTYMLSHDKGKCKKKIVSPTVKYTACQTGWTVKTFLIFASLSSLSLVWKIIFAEKTLKCVSVSISLVFSLMTKQKSWKRNINFRNLVNTDPERL